MLTNILDMDNLIDVKVEIDDITMIKLIIEILNGFVSEVNVDFIKDINAYTKKYQKITDDSPSEDTKTKKNKKSDDQTDTKRRDKKNKDQQNEDQNEDNKNKKNKKPDVMAGEDDKVEREKNPGQLKIFTTDTNQTLLSCIALNASDFKHFYVMQDEYRVGLNIDELFKYIKNVDKDGIMSIRIDREDSQNILFNVESVQTSKISKCELKVLNLKDRKKKNLEIDFSMGIRIASADFHKACKDLSQFSTHMEIICDPEKFTITCRGDMSTHSRIFKHDGCENGVVIMPINNAKGTKPDIIRLVFELKYINLMYKCLNLCKDMEIYLKAGSVMFLKYGIGLHSTMLVGIAPSRLLPKEKVLSNLNYDEEIANCSKALGKLNYDEDLDDYYEDNEIVPK